MAKFSQFQNNNRGNEHASQDEIRNKYDQYKDMSSTQLNQELLSEVARQKANGQFDYQALENMVNSLQGVLPWQDFQNIRRILETLK